MNNTCVSSTETHFSYGSPRFSEWVVFFDRSSHQRSVVTADGVQTAAHDADTGPTATESHITHRTPRISLCVVTFN